MATLAEIYNWFMTGKKPTQAQFWASWGSFWNKNESIPQSSISGLTSVLNAKVENDQFNAHKVEENAHATLFQAKEDKTQKGAPNGYAPLDEFTKLAAQYLNIVNDLVTGGATALLSAEQGKVLQTQVNAINTLLTSDNVNLDTVQELVDAIETVQISLSTILVNDLITGGTTKALTAEMGKQLDLIKESTANKSTSIVVDYLSDIKFPSVKAVYDFCMSAFKKKFLSFGDVTGITHTFGFGSENIMYKFSNNNPITATIPTNATIPFEIGTVFETIAIGNGALTVTGAPGVTILTNISNTSFKNEVRRYTKIDIDTWTVEGSQKPYVNQQNIFLDATNGNDSTGLIGDISRPFATINAVITAIASDPAKDYQINIKKGTYRQTVANSVTNVVYYSEASVILLVDVAPSVGNYTIVYNMPLSTIAIRYNGATNTSFIIKYYCAYLTINARPHCGVGFCYVRCDFLTLNNGCLFDSGISSNTRLDLNCQTVTSTGSSVIYTSAALVSFFNIVFDVATASSGTLGINRGSGIGYVKFKSYSSTFPTEDAFLSGSDKASVFYDFHDSSITNGRFNPGSNGFKTCIITGKVTVNTYVGSMFWDFAQFTFLNAYVICNTNLIRSSEGRGLFQMINSNLEIAGNYVLYETRHVVFTAPVLTAIGFNTIFQTGTVDTFFNFHPDSSGMSMLVRGVLKSNLTELPPGMTSINDTPTTF